MDSITFYLPKDVKIALQIKAIKQEKSMTDILVELVKNYVKD